MVPISDYLPVADIIPSSFRGNPATKVRFSGEGFKYGELIRPKDIVTKVLEEGTKPVILSGGEPLRQNLKSIVILSHVLKRMHKKFVVVETDATKFSQLLFLNVKHFSLFPKKENFYKEQFQRYLDNASYKLLEHYYKTKNYTPASTSTWASTTQFVEINFKIKEKEDFKFASEVFNSMIRPLKIKTYILRDCAEEVFGEGWREVNQDFSKYNFLYVVS